MTKLTLTQRAVCAALLLAATAAPAFAIDYEAGPVNWTIKAPIRLVGGLTGATVCGLFSGPVDKGYHWFLKGTTHVAGKFGDEKGAGQIAAAVPIGGSTGAVLGGGYGGLTGAIHGFKVGWEKPFSRWSYITMEEK